LPFPTPNGGCHPLWSSANLTLIEGTIPAILFGDKNPAADWQQYFGENSEPVADASAYPPFTEGSREVSSIARAEPESLESLSEKDLDKPTKAPPKGTRAGVFYVWPELPFTLALHEMLHRANVTDARRAAGRIALGDPGWRLNLCYPRAGELRPRPKLVLSETSYSTPYVRSFLESRAVKTVLRDIAIRR